jgi:hypothetical protein
MNEQMINNAFDRLAQARNDLYTANEKALSAQRNLAKAKIEVYKTGLIDGKNETDRKAQYAANTEYESDLADKAESKLVIAQLEFDLASYEVKRVNTIIAWIGIKQESYN